jgi:hypothetical protein
MKLLAIIILALSSVIARAEVLPKVPLEIGGKKYLYSDCLIITTGMSGKHLHHVVVHLDEEQYSDVVLRQNGKRPWPPRLSSGTVDLPLTSEGVYLVRKIEGLLRVDLIAGDPPMTEEKKAVEAYIQNSVMKPPMPPEQK